MTFLEFRGELRDHGTNCYTVNWRFKRLNKERIKEGQRHQSQ